MYATAETELEMSV